MPACIHDLEVHLQNAIHHASAAKMSIYSFSAMSLSLLQMSQDGCRQ